MKLLTYTLYNILLRAALFINEPRFDSTVCLLVRLSVPYTTQ